MSTVKQPSRETQVHIRWMIRRDMPEVLDIEREVFSDPWPEDEFLACYRQRTCIGMVAENRDSVLGFMLYELFKTHINLLNFAVSPWWWRAGIGRQLCDKLKNKVEVSSSRRFVRVMIRETNVDALLFFKRMGFIASEIHQGRYTSTDDDGIVMEWHKP